MSKRLGNRAVRLIWVAVCAAALFVLPILFGATLLQSALISAIAIGALAAALITEFMYRKAFPNLFRPFDKERRNRKVAGDSGE